MQQVWIKRYKIKPLPLRTPRIRGMDVEGNGIIGCMEEENK
jgi:hypothetical protein